LLNASARAATLLKADSENSLEMIYRLRGELKKVKKEMAMEK